MTLTELSESLLDQSLALSENQIYHIGKLHQQLRFRLDRNRNALYICIVVGAALTLPWSTDYYQNYYLIRNIGLVVCIGGVIILPIAVINAQPALTTQLNEQEEQYALRIIQGDLPKSVTRVRIRKRWLAGMKIESLLKTSGLLIFLALACHLIFFGGFSQSVHWVIVGLATVLLWLVIKPLRTLVDGYGLYRSSDPTDDRYLFLLGYDWKYPYQLPLLLDRDEFSAFEKEKIADVYDSIAKERGRLLFVDLYSWCWGLTCRTKSKEF